MTSPTDDTTPIDLVAGYVLDDLSPEEAAQLDRILADTPALQNEINAFQDTLSSLPYDLPLAEPSADLKRNILEAARRTMGDSTVAPHANGTRTNRSTVVPIASARSQRWQRWMPAISTGIAAIAVAALGIEHIQLGQQMQQMASLQKKLEGTTIEVQTLRNNLKASQSIAQLVSDPQTHTYALVGESATQPNLRPAARVFAKPGDRNVTLIAQNLPQLPEGQIYRFWSATKASPTPMFCGQFQQDSSGTAQWTASDDACMTNPLQMMITVEAVNNPITSPGPVVMQSLG
jgi:anti-sigma-K factor RskA